MSRKTIFVTVGTTHFDALTRAVCEQDTLDLLKQKGYTNIVIQIGQGKFIPADGDHNGVTVSHFRLKPSIKADFAAADLVISHAGAGSCLEALEAGKPLVAVVNDTLMANHQIELAEELANCGFCFFCYPSTLHSKLASMNTSELRPYIPGKPRLLTQYLDSVLVME